MSGKMLVFHVCRQKERKISLTDLETRTLDVKLPECFFLVLKGYLGLFLLVMLLKWSFN